jgi:anthranilate phosphoribosyltransferase
MASAVPKFFLAAGTTVHHDRAMTDILPPRAVTDTHDFAPYIRILGRGPGKSRSLTRAEAHHALGMVLRGQATREQVGAMLMLLRYRGEAADEMAGMVEAAREHAGLPLSVARPVDLDWPSYADGRTRGLPWYLLSALLLASAGVRVLMHGPLTGPGRVPLAESLRLFGDQSLETTGFAFVPLEAMCPSLAELLALRGILGLRSPLNTVCRLLNPADARGGVDGVFHPNYIAVHIGTAALLGRQVSVLKGGGGEAEWSGAKPLVVTTPDGEHTWPALDTAGKPVTTTPEEMKAVWDRQRIDPGGEATVIATAAVALSAAGWAKDPTACLTQAKTLWENR